MLNPQYDEIGEKLQRNCRIEKCSGKAFSADSSSN